MNYPLPAQQEVDAALAELKAARERRPYICLTCGVSLGPITEREAEEQRAEGHNVKLDEGRST